MITADRLDADKIRLAMPAKGELSVLESVTSTNDYVKTLVSNTFKISRETINEYPDVLQSKKNELKIKRIIKELKNE